MKKILLLVLFIFSIKISAYNYLIGNYPQNMRYLQNEEGNLVIEYYIKSTGQTIIYDTDNSNYWASLNSCHNAHSLGDFVGGSRTKESFITLMRNDLNFTNDLYTSNIQAILNFLYNTSSFGKNNHIEYSNYELFYNSNGLAVTSKVNEVYNGLYNNETILESGYLFNSKGDLVLVNGEEASYFQKFGNRILNPVKDTFLQANALTPLNSIMKIVICLTLLVFVIILCRRVINGNGRNVN